MRIESGIISGSKKQREWILHTSSIFGLNPFNINEGRTYKEHVNFTQPFKSTPNIVTSITQIEITNETFTRIKVSHELADKNGFDIVITTWGDTRVYSASVSWIAYGD